jgi:hypothetical protein
VIAGRGARLFHEGQASKHLQLADAKIIENGVVILTYKAANNHKAA